MTNLIHAHRQWANRPEDERFGSLEELQLAVDRRRDFSVEDSAQYGHLQVVPTHDGDILLDGLRRPLRFSNWSFQQFCSRLGAPAHYLKDLPADLVAQNLNEGLRKRSDGHAQIYSQLSMNPEVRAFTSNRYGRIYDSDVVRWVRQAVEGTSWKQPLANPPGKFGPIRQDAQPGGLYASDRDCFLFLIDEERRVEVGDESLARGFFVWNSETGAATFGLMTFLYRFVCGNNIVWGAEQVGEFRIRHVGDQAAERAYAHFSKTLNHYRNQNTQEERRVITQAIQKQVAKDNDEAEKYLISKGFKKEVAKQSVVLAELEEGGAGSIWQLTQGLTAYARSIPHRNERVQLERQAGALLNYA